MSAEHLSNRLGISKQALLSIEANEVRRTVSLGSLDKVAHALGCTVVYAIVPPRPLEDTVEERARAVARRRLARVGHSMALEGQQPPPDLDDLQIEELAQEIKSKLGRALWDDP